MGGSVKQAFSNPARAFNTVSTLGLSEPIRRAVGTKSALGKLTALTETGPNKIMIPISDKLFGTHYGDSGGGNDPSFNPLNIQMDPQGDSNAITGLGQDQFNQTSDMYKSQFGDNQAQIAKDSATRAAARDQMATLLQQLAAQTFKQTLPGTAEDYNAGGLLNSTGYQQEVARQQGNLAAQVSNQLSQQGVSDMYRNTDQSDQALAMLHGGNAAALGGLQGANQQGLARVFNLQDYAREANVAKQIGATTAPSTKPSKASGAAGVLGGAGTGASAGFMMGGPYGAMAGGIGGGLLGLLGSGAGGTGSSGGGK